MPARRPIGAALLKRRRLAAVRREHIVAAIQPVSRSRSVARLPVHQGHPSSGSPRDPLSSTAPVTTDDVLTPTCS
jgi:hypothetical protein